MHDDAFMQIKTSFLLQPTIRDPGQSWRTSKWEKKHFGFTQTPFSAGRTIVTTIEQNDGMAHLKCKDD